MNVQLTCEQQMNVQLTLGRPKKVVQDPNVSRLLPGKVVELHWCRSRRRRLRRLAAAATAAAAASADSSLPPGVHKRGYPRAMTFVTRRTRAAAAAALVVRRRCDRDGCCISRLEPRLNKLGIPVQFQTTDNISDSDSRSTAGRQDRNDDVNSR